MIKEIVTMRRKGMSFRKIAEKLNSTVGKVHYQWLKYSNTNLDLQQKKNQKQEDMNVNIIEKKDHYLLSSLTIEQKLVSHWKIATWQKEMIASYFQHKVNQVVIILRVYDVTDIYFNGANAHSYYEFQVAEDRSFWTIKGLKQKRTYITEIGYKVNHQFFPVLRSNSVFIPKMELQHTNSLQMRTFENNVGNQPNWINNVSTYSYYENINEVKS
ncbi:MAG TPA: DUF4912 domain-containing protein [Pseudoneobacillus sp.]|nr:DUF4912 domain-containing protein [Pseudoneobacillus sp.]